MNLHQAQKLYTLISTVRHVEKMNVDNGAQYWDVDIPGCLLCEGVRNRLYTEEKGFRLDYPHGFERHFGCTNEEAGNVIYHSHISSSNETTGENYYQAGKELLEKYGYGHLFDNSKAKSFTEIMDELRVEMA